MQIARTSAQLASRLASLPPVALVPTMGALHLGHLALVAAARETAPVVASIFVNPLQFGPGEDLARYPRDEAGDLGLLEQSGCAVAFLPDPGTIYPPGDATTVEMAGPALGWEGAARPGHFRGVATVVCRLFGLVRPQSAWFGQKDWQQLQVIRRMVQDLHLPVSVHDVATLREPDGLALSSRNRFLTTPDRARAPALARLCEQAAASIRSGMPVPAAVGIAREALAEDGFEVDYLAVVAPETLVALERIDGPARLIAAARLGGVRLLDNVAV